MYICVLFIPGLFLPLYAVQTAHTTFILTHVPTQCHCELFLMHDIKDIDQLMQYGA